MGTPLEGSTVPGSPGPALPPGAPRGARPTLSRTSLGARVRSTLWASRFSISYIAIGVAVALALVVVMGLLGFYDLAFIVQMMPQGVGPAEVDLEFATFTYLIGMLGALGLGLVRAYRPKKSLRLRQKLWRWPLYAFTSGYVAIIRGTPFLVQLEVVYIAMVIVTPRLLYLGWDVNYWAGFIALLINTTGYQTEVFRGGFQSVDAGQIEAAKAVGLGRVRTFFLVTLPQGFRLVTLPLTNEWISNFKTATILSIIGIVELFYWATDTIGLYPYAKPVEAFVLLAFFYLIVNVTLSRVVTYIEKVRRIPGLGSPIAESWSETRRLFGGAGPWG